MNLRDRARALFQVACEAADPGIALSRAMQSHPLPVPDPGGKLRIVAIGKAAVPMAEALLPRLNTPFEALVVTNYENARPVAGAIVNAAGHPVPDANGEMAAIAVEALLLNARPADRVIALISGGGSALLPAPVAGVTLAEKAEVSRILLGAGVDISQLNLVRQGLSRLKGGGLLQAARPAPVTAYILSDVIGDDLRVIASGLTVSPVGSRSEARKMFENLNLLSRLPESVRAALQRPEVALPPVQATNVLIGSNRKSLEAVVTAAGTGAHILSDTLTGDVADAAAQIITAAQHADGDVLVFGGETTVILRGKGLGGRNQELALRVAMGMPDLGRPWVFLSGGTDGRDGPTEAAGGLVDAGTMGRIRAAGGDATALLANNDSNRALALAGDLLVTGATGTNVADVQILVLGAR